MNLCSLEMVMMSMFFIMSENLSFMSVRILLNSSSDVTSNSGSRSQLPIIFT